MAYQTWVQLEYTNTATATAVANTTTETVLLPANSMLLPANFQQEPRTLEFWGFGGIGTTATPTLIISLRWGGVGGTVIAKSSTNTMSSAIGGGASMTAVWSIHGFLTVRTHGTSGTFMTNANAFIHPGAAYTGGTVANYGQPFPVVSGSTGGSTPATATVDTTAATDLTITGTWGTQNAANSINLNQFVLKSLN